jgi:hypothetical protein
VGFVLDTDSREPQFLWWDAWREIFVGESNKECFYGEVWLRFWSIETFLMISFFLFG